MSWLLRVSFLTVVAPVLGGCSAPSFTGNLYCPNESNRFVMWAEAGTLQLSEHPLSNDVAKLLMPLDFDSECQAWPDEAQVYSVAAVQ